jgi:hypothetical protein
MPTESDPLLGFLRTLARERDDFFAHLQFQRVFDVSAAPNVLVLHLCAPGLSPISIGRTDDLYGDVCGSIPVPFGDGRSSIIFGDADIFENWQNASVQNGASQEATAVLFWSEEGADAVTDMWASFGIAGNTVHSFEHALSPRYLGSRRVFRASSKSPWGDVLDGLGALVAMWRDAPFEQRWRQDHGEQGNGFSVLRVGDRGVLLALRLRG